MSEEYQIKDLSCERKYFASIPNIIFDMGLSPDQISVYCHLKRIAGDNGKSFISNVKLSEKMGISRPTLIKVKESLEKPFDFLGGKSLIQIQKRSSIEKGDQPDLVTIIDIWPENINHIANLKNKIPCKGGLHPPVKEIDTPCKPALHKEEPIKKNLYKKNNNPQPPSLDIESLTDPAPVVVVSSDTKKEQSKADAEKQRLFKRMKDLGLSDKTIEKAFHQSHPDIENAIECCLNRIESIDDVDSYFASALREKWKPKPSREKIAKIEEDAKKEKHHQQQKLYIEASTLALTVKNKLKDKYSIHITENCVRFDTPQGSTPMNLTKQSIDVIKKFIENNSKYS